MSRTPSHLKETKELLDVVERLRKECPWDRKQTHKSLIPYLLEEAYETIDAIEKKQPDSLCEELGDLLLQVALHAEISREKGKFSFEDVSKSIREKMVRRHPHVFASAKIKTAADQTKNWSKLKEKERGDKSLLSGLPKAMPALQLSQRYGEIAASVNFDWDSAEHVMEKVDEELAELKAEMKRKPRKKEALELELGDLFFVLTRLAGHLEIDAERALRKSAAKFERRFGRMERHVKKQGRKISEFELPELEKIWQRIKREYKD